METITVINIAALMVGSALIILSPFYSLQAWKTSKKSLLAMALAVCVVGVIVFL